MKESTYDESLDKAANIPAARRLGEVMRDASDDVKSAGWYIGIERLLWTAMQSDKPSEWTAYLPEIRHLSELAGGWWHWPDASPCEVFVTLEEWYAIVGRPTGLGRVKEKRTFYVRDDDDGCEQIESIVDCIDHMKPPFKITVEQIDLADVPPEGART